ncbi:uncharacterized protein [Tursiops truncatus]|uniref:Uncharacterized protein LOC109552480 isoform X1 n=1 Tax=Tursiops truncatus TaxID=9739 RepID=A0A6J3QRJ7_TURTR|nr:uncharacterized protein LOC109552480 isoform X1 [Tursiops truncatus]
MFSPYGRLFAEARAPRPAPLGYPAPPLVCLPPGPQQSPGFLDRRSYGVPTCGGPLFAYSSSGPCPWRATTPIPAGNSTLASNLSSPDVPDVVLDFFDWPCVAVVPNSAEMAGFGELPPQGPPLHLQGLNSPQPAKTMQMKVVQKVLDRMLMGCGIHLTPHIGDPPEGRELDSAADVKSGNVVHHLVMPKSVSFDTKEESEHQYENADEEKEDGNEKPEEGRKLDMVSAEGSSGEYSWKA